MITKICNCCNKEYPATSEFFHKDSSGKLGLKAFCKKCKNGVKFRFTAEGNHLCKSCGRELPFTEEYFVNNPKSGNLTSPCRECRGLKFNLPIHRKINKKAANGNKICIKCKNEYPLNKLYFLVNSYAKCGFSSRCRVCNGTKFVEYKENTILNEDEKFCSKCKEIKNKFDFHTDNSKKDRLSTICKECRSFYNKSNKDKRNLKLKYRRKEDINFRIKNSLRCRISAALTHGVKSKSTIKLLGCSIDYFIKYLENKMSEKMSWNNYGVIWHIDHIIPCNYFDLTIPKNQEECFNYINMQPMFAEDNLIKQGYSILQVIYKTSNNYKNNNFSLTNKHIIDER